MKDIFIVPFLRRTINEFSHANLLINLDVPFPITKTTKAEQIQNGANGR